MIFNRTRSEQLYNVLHAQVADGDVDGEAVLDVLDQLQFGWERIAQLEELVRHLENQVYAAGVR